MRFIMLAGALALIPFAAQAGTSFDLSGSYANFSDGGGDVYNADAAATTTFGGDWGGEITGGYHHVTLGGGRDLGNAGGSVFWQSPNLRVAVTGNFADLNVFHLATYGAGAEWYAAPDWTLAARAGGASGQFNVDGGYVGGDVKHYFTPDVAVNVGVDYINLSGFAHVVSEDIRAEWLVSETTPIAVFGGYGHVESSGTSQDVFFVGVKLYVNDGAANLADRQRSGALGYISGIPYFGAEL